MADKKFLDSEGLVYLWSKIKAAIAANKVTKTSELTNDSGFLTSHQDISGKVDKVSGKGLSTNDYTTAEKTKLEGIAEGANKTTIDTALSGTSTNPVQNKVVNTALSNKVDKVSGKGLSANDYTDDKKTKLAGIAAGANKVTKTSELTNDSGFLVEHQSLTGYATETWVEGKKYLTTHQDISGKANKATTLAGYGISDAYTKTQIDSMLAAALTYKGQVDKFTDLPAKPNKGDVYNVKTAGGTGADGTTVKAGDNVVYNGTGWDVLGGDVDLSGYVLATDVISNTQIDTITA